MDVAIVIPTREEGRHIGRSLSLFREEISKCGERVLLIVVDAGSADATVEIARPIADVVVSDRSLRGIARARNFGARATGCSLIFHTDADVVVPDFLGLLARVHREFKDPRVVAMTVPIMPHPEEATSLDRLIHRLANRFFHLSFRGGAYFARGECQIVRRDAFDAVGGYREDLVSGEDCDLFRRMAKRGRIKYVSDLQVFHSTRRFKQQGYLRTLCVYLREGLWLLLFDRSYAREWRVFR